MDRVAGQRKKAEEQLKKAKEKLSGDISPKEKMVLENHIKKMEADVSRLKLEESKMQTVLKAVNEQAERARQTEMRRFKDSGKVAEGLEKRAAREKGRATAAASAS